MEHISLGKSVCVRVLRLLFDEAFESVAVRRLQRALAQAVAAYHTGHRKGENENVTRGTMCRRSTTVYSQVTHQT